MEGKYYKTKESVQEYIEMAKDVNGRKLIDELVQYLPAGSELLELGSGPGTDWKILNETYLVTGSDFSEEFLKHLKSSIPKGEFLKLDAEALQTKRQFDGIYSNKVLHHLTDEALKKSISRQQELLKPNGVICHSFWKGEGTEVFKGLFVNNHIESELIELFGGKFEVLVQKCYTEFEDMDSILLIARRK